MKKMKWLKNGALAVTLGAGVMTATGSFASVASTPVDDAALASAVQARLEQDPTVEARSTRVEALQGVVNLSGYASRQFEKDRAAAVARATQGVVSVKNRIEVYP